MTGAGGHIGGMLPRILMVTSTSRALVTGASGFIGSELVRQLCQKGFEVRVLLRASSSTANLEGCAYQRVTGDLGSEESLKKAAEGVDYVFHLAGTVAAPDRDTYFKQNADGTERLAKAVAEAQGDRPTLKRFVFVSSLAAGGPSPTPEPRKEGDPDQPVSAYGQSKHEAEIRLMRFKDRYPISIVRPPLVYGPRDRGVYLFFKTVSRNLMPIIPGTTPTGEKYYSAIYVDDLCDLIYRAAFVSYEKGIPSGEVFYGSDGAIYSFQDIMGTIAEAMDKKPFRFKVPVRLLERAAGVADWASRRFKLQTPLSRDKLNELLPDYWTCDTQKAVSLLGFEPRTPFASGARKTVQWYKEHRWI